MEYNILKQKSTTEIYFFEHTYKEAGHLLSQHIHFDIIL